MEFEDILKKALQDSVMDAFTTTLSLSPELSEKCLEETDGGLISSIGFTGTIEGSVMINLSNQSACAIVSKMLGMDFEEVDADVCDGVGEVINIIVGGIKMKVAGTNCKFEIGIPTTVMGNEMKISSESETLTKISYHFICEDITFSVVFIYKLHQETEDAVEPVKQEENKPNPLDLLNQAVTKSEQAEKGSSEKVEAVKPNAADLLSQLVGSAGPSGGESVKSEEESPKEAPPVEEKKPNPLDLLNQAVAKSEQAEEGAFEEKEVKTNAVDLLNQAVNASGKENIQENGSQEESIKEDIKEEEPKEQAAPQEKMNALEKLDQAMKQFKDIL